jgi:di/tricarboxylate transporter
MDGRMNTDLWIVLGLLLAAIIAFAINKPRMDAVALIVLTALPFTGVITMNESLAGFSDPNIVLIAALFVVGDGLVRTGVARRLGDWLTQTAGSSDIILLILLMLVVGLLGSIMSSTAVTAIFVPVAIRISQRTGVAPSRLMMPISFAALISGMMTLVATAPNLVVNSELIRHGEKGFQFFSFTPFGVPILILGIIYMIFARRWLAPGGSDIASTTNRPSLADWVQEYKLAEREYRLRITNVSPWVGQTIEELNLRQTAGANVIAIERNRRFSLEVMAPTAKFELRADDILLIDLFAADADIRAMQDRYALEPLPLTGNYFNNRSQEIGMAEVILPGDSAFVGKTIEQAKIRAATNLTVIGLRRGRNNLGDNLLEEVMKVGDTLLVVGPWNDIERLGTEESALALLRLPADIDDVLPKASKAIPAVVSLLVVVTLMATGLVPNVQAALIGCLLMGAFGCIDLQSAYRAIDWKTVILIVGMLPFSIALERTGGVDLMADFLLDLVGSAGTPVALGSVFAITAGLGLFISNTATAVLMAPVAIAIAEDLNASPYPFAMIVALAASTAFMTPVSSPVNTLVVTPGNYTFWDFVRVGVPFSLVVMILSVILVPRLLPL